MNPSQFYCTILNLFISWGVNLKNFREAEMFYIFLTSYLLG